MNNAIRIAQPFSVLTIADPSNGAPAWNRTFGWPVHADAAIALDARLLSRRNIWAAQMDEAVRSADRAILLVAEGLGCAAAAWWARLSPAQDVSRVAGALLFNPVVDVPEPVKRKAFAAPDVPLSFPSLVIDTERSAGDIDAAIGRWGSRIISPTRAARDGTRALTWRNAQRLFLRLTSQIVDYEVKRISALNGIR